MQLVHGVVLEHLTLRLVQDAQARRLRAVFIFGPLKAPGLAARDVAAGEQLQLRRSQFVWRGLKVAPRIVNSRRTANLISVDVGVWGLLASEACLGGRC